MRLRNSGLNSDFTNVNWGLEMRTGVFTAGVLMMIIGGALVVFIPTGGQTPFIEIGGVGILLHQVIGAGLAVLGFLVFIVGLAASPPEKKTTAPVITYGPSAPQPAPSLPKVLVICPECGARVSAMSKFCPECGGKLGSKKKAESSKTKEGKTEATEGKPKEAGLCTHCRTELPEDSDFCPECGRKVK